MNHKIIKTIIGFALIIAASTSYSCAVCGFGDDPAREAFILTTGILTAVPLLFIGGLIFLLRKKIRQAKNEEAQQPN
tara:strand:- start:249 stop:479 length:231 start_codon:yes stop_codon:yes gene_type:complete